MARVLVVDDDEMFSDMLIRSVDRLGHEARCVHSLADGLEQVATGKYDIVCLDVHLPDGNGLEALPRIRESPGQDRRFGDLPGAVARACSLLSAVAHHVSTRV